jgi:hypothetical protein
VVLNEIILTVKIIIMKKNISIILLFAFTFGLLSSCEKKLTYVDPSSTTDGLAFIKVIDASPNFRQVFKGSDSFNIYVNGLKVNGGQLSYNSIFPTATNLYAGVPAGPQSIRVTVNGKVNPDSITLLSVNKTLDAGSYYSFIITDEALGSNEARQMFLKDNFALTDTSHFTLRFIDAVLNDATPVDVYSINNAANIFTNISPGTTTAFSSFNYNLTSDILSIRVAGTLTEITKVTGAVLTRSRAYTLLYKGSSVGTGTKARTAIVYANN